MGIVNIRGTDFEAPIGYFTGTLYYQAEAKDADQAVAEFKRQCARLFGIYPKAHGSWTFVFHPVRKSLAVSGPFLVIPFRDREDFERRCEGSAFNISEIKGPIPIQENLDITAAETLPDRNDGQAAPLPAVAMMRIAGPVHFDTPEKDKHAAIRLFCLSCRDLGIYTSPFGRLYYEMDMKNGGLIVHGSFFAVLLHGLDEFEKGCREHGLEISTDCRQPAGTPIWTGSVAKTTMFKGKLEYRTEAESMAGALVLFEEVCQLLGIYPSHSDMMVSFDPAMNVLYVRGIFFAAPYVSEDDFRRRCLACGVRTNGLFEEDLEPFASV